MNDGKTKQNKKQKLKSQCKIKHSLFLACAYREIDARGQFFKAQAEAKRSFSFLSAL